MIWLLLQKLFNWRGSVALRRSETYTRLAVACARRAAR